MGEIGSWEAPVVSTHVAQSLVLNTRHAAESKTHWNTVQFGV